PAAAEAPPRPAPALAVPGTAEADASGLGWGPLLACGVVTLTVFFAALLLPTVRKGLAAPAVPNEAHALQAEPAPAPPRTPAAPPPAAARIGFGHRLGALVIDTVVIVIGGAAFAVAGAVLGIGAGRSLAAGLASPAHAADATRVAGLFGGLLGAVV